MTSVDLVSDDATYSYRSLGWFDYLAAEMQTTPVQWFDSIPGWSNLSFHDGPPVVFAVQKLFFVLFGDNIWGAKLPFLIAGLLLIFLMYLIGKELKNETTGLIAAGLTTVLSFGLWSSLIGYLENIEIVFIALSIYFWIKFLKNANKKKFLYLWGISIGLALMCKYTAIFLIPVFLVYALFFARKIFKFKELYLTLVIILLILSPVIFYNIKVWQTREHFDAAVSSAVGIQHEDFEIISSRSVGGNYLIKMGSLFKSLHGLVSLPILILFYLSLIYFIYIYIKKKFVSYSPFILFFGSIIVILFLAWVGFATRFLPIIIPFLVLSTAYCINQILSLLKQQNLKNWYRVGIAIFIVVLAWEFLYNINSNFLIKPISENFLIYAKENIRDEKLGFNAMERYLRKEVLPKELELKRPGNLKEIDIRAGRSLEHNPVIYFFDDSINWFAHNWYFRKYSSYYGIPLTPLYGQAKDWNVENPFKHFASFGVNDYYFIYAVDERVVDPAKIDSENRKASNMLSEMLENNKVDMHEIKNYSGGVAFKIYKFSL